MHHSHLNQELYKESALLSTNLKLPHPVFYAEVHLLFPVHHASQSSKALENCILVHLQETAED